MTRPLAGCAVLPEGTRRGARRAGVLNAAAPTGSARQVLSGDPTRIVTDTVELAIVRRLDNAVDAAGATLTGTWPDQPTPLVLAYATAR